MTDLPVPAAAPALVRHRGASAPLSIPEAMQFAEAVAKADGMIPRAYLGNPGKILACVLAGQELGVGPMASLRAFHIVEGKPVASYDFWIARLRAAGYRVEWPQLTTEAVTLRLTSPNGETHVETWDKARAQAAGLWGGKDPWKRYPQTMLQARCVATAGRAFAGEVMFGCYEQDEMDEFAGRRPPQPEQAAPPTPAPTTAAERIAAAVGGTVEAVTIAPAVAELAKQVAEGAKALNYTRDSFNALMDRVSVPRQRLTQCSVEQLETLLDALRADRDADADVAGVA
ncbi:MAG: hypothetical protein ACK52I_06885 [Pseudomonadota bacterium]